MNVVLKKDRADRAEILRHTLKSAEKFYTDQPSLAPGLVVEPLKKDVLPDDGIGALQAL